MEHLSHSVSPDVGRPSSGFIHFDDHRVQLRPMLGGFHANRHLRQEFLQNNILVDADHGMIRAGHTHIGLIRRAIRQNARVRGRDVRVRADHRGNPAVQIPAHGHLLAGQLGVKIYETDFRAGRQILQNLIGLAKGTIGLRHVGAALQIDNRAVDPVLRFDHHHAASGEFLDVVAGTQQPRLAGKIIVNFALIPDVVAAGEDVQPVAEQFIGKRRSNAEASRGILGVGDGEIDFFSRDDGFKMSRDEVSPGRGENVADEKQIGQDELSKERTT
jgi:hypothetical protein